MATQSTTFAAAPMPPAGFPNNIRGTVSSRLFHTGTQGAALAADFNNTTPGATTEIYVAEMAVLWPCLTTGAAPFNGSDATDKTQVALFDVNGTILLSTADTQMSGTDAYQRIPWASEFITTPGTATAITKAVLLQPGTYYLAQNFNGTTSRFQTFAVGNFGAGKVTSAVYATAFHTTSLTLALPTTFTTVLGPVISLY